MAANNNKSSISTIGMALAGKSDSVEIPKPAGTGAWNGKDGFAVAAAKSAPSKGHRGALPTPPNSISPNLPPHPFKDTREHSPLTPPAHGVDSDIDLQDAVEHAAAQDRSARGYGLGSGGTSPGEVDSTGSITSTLLAAHHLPSILLNHGPVAIRHIMGHLTTSVPGFSGIPAAKARRIVVGALEGRSAEATGGVDGEVIFEKVGWGRWDARHRGQPSKHASRQSSPISTRHRVHSPSPYARNIFHIPHRPRNSRNRMPSSTSLSVSHRSENEADRMSMDEEGGSASCSEAPEDAFPNGDDGEMTDEEDWASIGAAALRAGFSLPKAGAAKKGGKYDYNERVRRESSTQSYCRKRSGGGPTSSALAKSAPTLNDVNMKDLMEGVGEDDAEAVKALLQLGSM
ncbi:MAG: hypothetical protein LQ340_007144 [Diploschistes diacapsis]|nr:MAG: hypothetical protein LQ340_007144 [Diploschistes diacapsis]